MKKNVTYPEKNETAGFRTGMALAMTEPAKAESAVNAVSAVLEPEIQTVIKARPAFTAVSCQVEAADCNAYFGRVIQLRKRIKEFFRPARDNLKKLKASLDEQEEAFDKRPREDEQNCRKLLTDWQWAEAKRVADEQTELDRKAREQAAEQARKDGKDRLAKQIEKGTVAVTTAEVAAPAPKLDGMYYRTSWVPVIQNKLAFLQGIVDGKVPDTLVTIEESKLKAMGTQAEGRLTYPGITWRKEQALCRRTQGE